MGAVLVAALFYVHSSAFRGSVERRAEVWLSEQLGRATELRLVRLRPLSLNAAIEEFSIAGADPGASFVELKSGLVDLDLWPLLTRRVSLSELTLDGMLVDLRQAPELAGSQGADRSGGSEEAAATFGDWLDRVAVEEGRLSGGRVRMGDATWPVELDARGIAWRVEQVRAAATPQRYRIRLEVQDGAARLANEEWFAVGATLDAELDAAGLRVQDLRLTGPGFDVTGDGSLDDLANLSGASEAQATVTLDALPWPETVAPEQRPGGTVIGSVSGSGSGTGVQPLLFQARLSSERIALGLRSLDAVQVDIAGSEGALQSTFSAVVSGAQIAGELRGQLAADPAPLEGTVSLSVPDVATLSGLLEPGTELPLQGQLTGEFFWEAASLSTEAVRGRFTVEGMLRPGMAGPADDLSIATRAEGSFQNQGVVLERLAARGAGLALSGQGRADLTTGTELHLELKRETTARTPHGRESTVDTGATLRGVVAMLRAAGLEPALPPGAAQLRGDVEAKAQLRGPGLESLSVDSLSGELELLARGVTAVGESGLPTDADIQIDLAGGQAALRTAQLRAPGVEIDLAGAVSSSSLDAELAVHADHGTAVRLLREWIALGFESPVPTDVISRIDDVRAGARLSGPWDAPSGAAELETHVRGAVAEQPARPLSVQATLERGALRSRTVLGGEGDAVTVALDVENLAERPPRGSAHFELTESSPLFWIAPDDSAPMIEGRLAAEGVVALETGVVEATLEITAGVFGGGPFELDSVNVNYSFSPLDGSPLGIEIEDARLRAMGGVARVQGALGASGSDSSLSVRATGLQLGDMLRTAGVAANVAGSINVDATVRGELGNPRIEATLQTQDLSVENQPLSDLAGELVFENERLRWDLSGRDSAVAAIQGTLQANPGMAWCIHVDYPLQLSAAPWLPAASDIAPDIATRLVIDLAQASASGVPGDISGRIELQDTELTTGPDTFVPRAPPVIRVEHGAIQLEPFSVDVAGRALEVEASAQLELGVPLDSPVTARVQGAVPLRSLAALLPGSRLDGTADLALTVSGTAGRPQWRGGVRLEDARFDHPDLPAPISGARATLDLGPAEWRVEQLEFLMGGGQVSGSGAYRLAKAATAHPSWLEFQLRGRDVRIPSIEGLRSQMDAELELSGTPGETLTLAGTVAIDRAVYGADINLQRELLAKSRIVDRIDEVGGVLDRIRMNLQVNAPGTLFVRNNIASLTTSASVRVTGTVADPLVTGQAEFEEGGHVVFRGVEYSVSRGTLDYTADPPDNPRLDIEGETSVGSYDIGLQVTGQLADPQVDLSSSPPLAQADIVSLLVTGKTRDDLASSGAGISEAQAALYLGSGVTREIERTLARSLGLDQVTLDPALVASEDDPAARLTVGKALTGRLFASYSREFGGSSGDIYQLRFAPFERLSFLGQQDATGELLTDAYYERKFYVGPPRPGPADGEAERGSRIERIAFNGLDVLPTQRARKALGLRLRDPLRRSALLGGLDRIRDQYLQLGYPEAAVDASVDAPSDKGGKSDVAIVVSVDEGRHVDVVIDGTPGGALKRKMKRDLLGWWQKSVFRDEIAADSRRRALALLADYGYVKADVEPLVTEIGSDRVELRLQVTAGPRVRIERVVVEGNQALDDETILQQFLILGDSLLKRDWLRPKLLAEDINAVRGLYLERGYLDVEVDDPVVSYDRGPGQARIDVVVDEGPRYDIGTIAFEGNQVFDDARLRAVAGIAGGNPYVDADVRQARARLRAFYDAEGYPGTQIVVRRIAGDRVGTEARADLLLTVEETSRAVVESVSVDNPGLTRTSVIESHLDFQPGEPLSADKLARTRQALYRTGLFRSVTLTDVPGTSEGSRRLELKLDERSNVRTRLGVGYGTDQGPRGSVSVSHSNLGGERLFGSVGARGSRSDWRVYSLLRQPNLFRTRLNGLATASIEQEERESFDLRRKSVAVQLEPELRQSRGRWFVGYRLQEADVFRDGVEADPGSVPDFSELVDLRSNSIIRLADVNAGLTLGARDDFAWPSDGQIVHAKLSMFDSAVGSEADFARAVVQSALYRPLGSGWIWSVGLRMGVAEPYAGQSAVPLSERFFVGGDNSVRGFRRDSITAVGFPTAEFEAAGIQVRGSLGGEASVVFNQELIVPFYDPIALALFYDAGNVYWRRSDVDVSELRHAAGVGLRVRTPIGPLRLEYGWKLDRQPDEDSGRLHFSVGVPF